MTVTAAVHEAVLLRDGACIAASLDLGHVCRDKWGEKHFPHELEKLTVEHVRDHAGGARYDDELHLVTLCHGANAWEHWGSAHRDLCRAYLLAVRAMSRAAA
jgi:hypothetical protein